jgi:hypothetical protein
MPSATEPATDELTDSTAGLTVYSEVRYAGGVFTIDVDICSALFEYALELARRRRWDTVTLPSLVSGLCVDTTILLGPDSQIWCSPVSIGFVNIADDDVVRELREKISLLEPRAIEASNDDSRASAADTFDVGY